MLQSFEEILKELSFVVVVFVVVLYYIYMVVPLVITGSCDPTCMFYQRKICFLMTFALLRCSTDLILGHTNYLFLQLTWSKNTLISLCVVEYHGNLYKLYEPTGIRCDSKLNSLKFVFLKFYLHFIFIHNIGT